MHLARGTLYNILRPQRFLEVIGQDNTVKSVQMALAKGVLEHALIFYGQTGGGKTTLARIVAKYLQCDDVKDNEPCCICNSCISIKQDNFSDYVELNAATNGGKEDIDRLLENVNFSPSFGKARAYVIDEAQRLSQSAWASLLKVLEEPPEHAYFILCTTEFESIPDAIKNRCGKYEFSRIGKADIFNSLKKIRESEGVKFTDEALELISESADGSMRNAINSFSHISMPFGMEDVINASDVKKYLSLTGPETMAGFIKAVCERNLKAAIDILESEQKQAVGADTFIKSILLAVSDCITIYCGAGIGREISDEYRSMLVEIQKCGAVRLSAISSELNMLYSRVSDRTYEAIKVVVMRLCVASDAPDESVINVLLERIEKLENTILQAADIKERKETEYVASENSSQESSYQEHECDLENFQNEECNYEDYDFSISDNLEYDGESLSNCIQDSGDLEFLSMFDDESGSDFYDCGQDKNPFESDYCADSTQNNTKQEVSGEFHTNIGNYDAGITFSSPETARQFEMSQDESVRNLKALKGACEQDILLKTLVDCCQAEKTKTGVALATPFAPVAKTLMLMISLFKLKGIDVIPVDGIAV